MLKKINDIRIFGAILIIILVMFIALGYLDSSRHEDANFIEVDVYFLSPVSNTIVSEPRSIAKGSNEDILRELLNEFLVKGPRNTALAKTNPDHISLFRAELMENRSRLQLEFTSDDVGMTAEEELFFKSALCWTMTELDTITDVLIYINDREISRADGGPVGLLNRENTIIDPTISPFKAEVFHVMLYFTDSSYMGLFLEERVIQVFTTAPSQNMARHVVEQIIKGPSRPEHLATVAPETKIHEVNTEGDICYVNLSADVFSRVMNPYGDMGLTIYSLVNSLTELDGIKRVQFLIDSKKAETVEGGYDLSIPIERDEDRIFISDYRR